MRARSEATRFAAVAATNHSALSSVEMRSDEIGLVEINYMNPPLCINIFSSGNILLILRHSNITRTLNTLK